MTLTTRYACSGALRFMLWLVKAQPAIKEQIAGGREAA